MASNSERDGKPAEASFLGIPPELRLEIFEHVISGEQAVVVPEGTTMSTGTVCKDHNLA